MKRFWTKVRMNSVLVWFQEIVSQVDPTCNYTPYIQGTVNKMQGSGYSSDIGSYLVTEDRYMQPSKYLPAAIAHFLQQ